MNRQRRQALRRVQRVSLSLSMRPTDLCYDPPERRFVRDNHD